MAKSFKLKISRVFPSFQSCRSKDPSDPPSNPVRSFLKLSSVNTKPITLHLPPPPPQQPTSSKLPHYSSLKRHVSSAFSSIGCGLGSRSSARYFSETDRGESRPPPTPEFHWEKEDRWHVIAKVYDGDETPRHKIYNSPEKDHKLFPHPPPPNKEKNKRRYKKKKTTPKNIISTSSAYSGVFSSQSFDDRETETLVSSSRNLLSTEFSSEFNVNLETIRETKLVRVTKKKRKGKKVTNAKRNVAMRLSTSSESESPARLSSFLQRMLVTCTVEGKVRESFAVVKQSEDPYEDFKRSMMEMILEKQMFEDKDLEQLLHCLLSLNSRHHHGLIVQAFADVWEGFVYSKID